MFSHRESWRSMNSSSFLMYSSSTPVHLAFISARGLAGLACGYDADGLSHDTDVMCDGLCHLCLVLLRNLTQGFMDAAQDFPLLLFAHGITSKCYVSISYRFVSAIDNVA